MSTDEELRALQAELSAARTQIASMYAIGDRYMAAIESSGLGLWDWNIATGDVYFSDTYKTMLGFQPHELENSFATWEGLMHPNDLPLVQEMLQAYLQGTLPVYEIEHRLRTKDGNWKWIIARGDVSERDAEGNPTRMTGTHTDNTRQRAVQEQLHRMNTELETLVAERAAELQRSTDLLHNIMEHLPVTIYELDVEGIFTFSDGRGLKALGLQPGQVVGTSVFDMYADYPVIMDAHHAAQRGEEQHIMARVGKLSFENWLVPVRDEQGAVCRVIGLALDITERVEAEEEHQLLTERIIQMQRAAIRELSTPLIPIADGVVIMPLIGAIDTARAHAVLETLLEGVAAQHAHAAILDITGVQMVDTQVANALIQAAQAVRLLGAQVILTGIQPQIAQTLVTLGVNLGDIVTCSTLQAGIAYAVSTGQQARR